MRRRDQQRARRPHAHLFGAHHVCKLIRQPTRGLFSLCLRRLIAHERAPLRYEKRRADARRLSGRWLRVNLNLRRAHLSTFIRFALPHHLYAHLDAAAHARQLGAQRRFVRLDVTAQTRLARQCAKAKRQRRHLHEHTSDDALMRQHMLARDLDRIALELTHDRSDLIAPQHAHLRASNARNRIERVGPQLSPQTISIEVQRLSPSVSLTGAASGATGVSARCCKSKPLCARAPSTSCAVSIDVSTTFKPTKIRSISATEIVISPASTNPRVSTWSSVSSSDNSNCSDSNSSSVIIHHPRNYRPATAPSIQVCSLRARAPRRVVRRLRENRRSARAPLETRTSPPRRHAPKLRPSTRATAPRPRSRAQARARSRCSCGAPPHASRPRAAPRSFFAAGSFAPASPALPARLVHVGAGCAGRSASTTSR